MPLHLLVDHLNEVEISLDHAIRREDIDPILKEDLTRSLSIIYACKCHVLFERKNQPFTGNLLIDLFE